MLNLASGLIFLGASVFVCLVAAEMSVGRFQAPGPGLYPLLLGICLGILSLFLCVEGFSSRRDPDQRLRNLISPHAPQVVLIIASLWTYSMLLALFGYSVATFLVLVLMFRSVDSDRSWGAIAILVLALTLSTEVLAFLLEIPLPGALAREHLVPALWDL